MSRIASVKARQVLDSRGRPTIEVEVRVDHAVPVRASVPSGASRGTAEAHELRDGDQSLFNGLGVLAAVESVSAEIAPVLTGLEVTDQAGCDRALRQLDGTPTLARLGANAIVGTSLAICRASAQVTGQPLYQRIADLAGVTEPSLPMPMVNILSGGMHVRRGMDIQDILAVPLAATTMQEAIHLVARVRDAANVVCAERGMSTLLADEGGISPECRNGRDALELMTAAIERAGLSPGHDVAIAVDVAATSLYDAEAGEYLLACEGRSATTGEMIDMVAAWVEHFPIVSIEDPLDEEDWAGWHTVTEQIAGRVQVVGDDLFTTNLDRLTRGFDNGCATGVLIKPNQNGTLTGTLNVMAAAREAQYVGIVSARSGETEDELLADLAVGTAAGQIKVGSLRTSERLAKYNQLLRIAEDPSIPFTAFATPAKASIGGAM